MSSSEFEKAQVLEMVDILYVRLAECVPVTVTSIMYLSSLLKVKICKTTFEAVFMANRLLRSSNLFLRSSNLLLRSGNLLSKCSCLH